MGHGDLTVLVAALFLIRYLVFQLDAAGARLDKLLGEQVGGLSVTKARVDIGDDRDDMRLIVIDFSDQFLLF